MTDADAYTTTHAEEGSSYARINCVYSTEAASCICHVWRYGTAYV